MAGSDIVSAGTAKCAGVGVRGRARDVVSSYGETRPKARRDYFLHIGNQYNESFPNAQTTHMHKYIYVFSVILSCKSLVRYIHVHIQIHIHTYILYKHRLQNTDMHNYMHRYIDENIHRNSYKVCISI